jgi:molecular chaperone HtpG
MTTQTATETLGFTTEVKQLLHLVTHALYSNKEIFLRELISNASDALERLRFEALNDSGLYEQDSELKIWVNYDKNKRIITIRDNGIGMNRNEAIENLGTIAKSGTKNFLAALSGDKAKDNNLIGQFGVGFYSSFIVADKVIVKTRRAGMQKTEGILWESTGTGDYTITNIEKDTRGTEVVLCLKADEDEFLDSWRLRSIITKYSDHILFPIIMPKPEFAADKDNKDAATKIEEETVNRATALWTLPKKDIKETEYQDFYKHLSHDFEDALLFSHNRVEGKIEYTSLLYIPQRPPFDLWQREQRHGLKLYINRVFIMDDAEQLLPNYLRFAKGVVDSKDLPLNVSRELLQNNKTIETIRSGVAKRILDMLEKLAQDDSEKYSKFWQAFGQVLKEGPAEDSANKERIAKLLRFASTHNTTAEQNVTLDEYLKRMPTDQDKIYYVTADSFAAAQNSPHLEIFRKKGIEVLLLSDRVDEWLLSHLFEYGGKSLQSVAKGSLDLGKLADTDLKEKQEKAKDEFAPTLKKIQDFLKDQVKEVRISDRLTDSPSCLVVEEAAMSPHLIRMMQAVGQNVPTAKPILELNPEHPMIKKLNTEADMDRFNEWAQILFDQALLAEGGQLTNPADFVKRLNKLLMETAI